MDKLEDISDIRKILGILKSTKAYKMVAEAIEEATAFVEKIKTDFGNA